MFFSILGILERKNIFFSVKKEEKPAIISVQFIYSLYSKIEEHSWKIKRNSNQVYVVLLYNNLGFSVCKLFEYASHQERNQILDDTYIYGWALEDIYLNRG